MKKKVAQFVKKLGGIAKYSGKTKTMHIHADGVSGIKADDIEDAVLKNFRLGLRFTIASAGI